MHIAASSESYNIAVTVEWSKFVRNTASSVLSCTGGAMYATGPAVTTRQSEFVASVCSSTRELARGGALFADYGTLALTGCRFANNYVNSSETGQQDRRNLSPSPPTPHPWPLLTRLWVLQRAHRIQSTGDLLCLQECTPARLAVLLLPEAACTLSAVTFFQSHLSG